jgi:hypothetical protein
MNEVIDAFVIAEKLSGVNVKYKTDNIERYFFQYNNQKVGSLCILKDRITFIIHKTHKEKYEETLKGVNYKLTDHKQAIGYNMNIQAYLITIENENPKELVDSFKDLKVRLNIA